MDDLRKRAETLGRGLALLAAYAVVIGALSIAMNLGGAIEGEVPAIARAVLGVRGLGAGVLLWTGRRVGISGWQAVMIWAVVQIPLIAWNTEGSPLVQVLEFPLSGTSQTTVNGEVTSFSQFGINLVGVALAIWTSRTRERWDRRAQISPAAA